MPCAVEVDTRSTMFDRASDEWVVAILDPPDASSQPAYPALTTSFPSTVGMFATPTPIPTPPSRAPAGRGGPRGDFTMEKLDRLLDELEKRMSRPDRLSDMAMCLKVLSAVLTALDEPNSCIPPPPPPPPIPSGAAHQIANEDWYDGVTDEEDPEDHVCEVGKPAAGASGAKVQTYWSKGTGFGFGGTSASWDRDAWLAERRARANHDDAVLRCIERVLSVVATDSPVSKGVANDIVSVLVKSALPALLAELMATDSMVDIAQHRELYEAGVRVVHAIAKDEHLISAFEEHKSTAAVADALLKTMRSLDRIKLSGRDLPTIDAYRRTAALIQGYRHDSTAAYVSASQSHDRMDYCDVLGLAQFGEFEFEHHRYAADAKAAGPPPGACTERLMHELASLATSLPLHEGSSIFLRFDPNRLNLMKALITGPQGTPYESGCFEFDMYFPHAFPAVPPLVSIMTTGGGSVRFNPNLYANGMVCLSILGTWPGRPEEQWGPHCTVLQVLTSIQSLVLVEEPYFNEPGYERSRGTEYGDVQNNNYTRTQRSNTLRHAIIEQMRTPSPAFAKVIEAHFFLKSDEVMDTCTKWEAAAAISASTKAAASADGNGVVAAVASAANTVQVPPMAAEAEDPVSAAMVISTAAKATNVVEEMIKSENDKSSAGTSMTKMSKLKKWASLTSKKTKSVKIIAPAQDSEGPHDVKPTIEKSLVLEELERELLRLQKAGLPDLREDDDSE